MATPNRPILHLNLTKKWFDLIESGVKKEEYREIKPYWDARFSTGKIKIKGQLYDPKDVLICFSNGMKPNGPRFYIECLGLEIKTGIDDWGAKEGIEYYTLKLGNILTFGMDKATGKDSDSVHIRIQFPVKDGMSPFLATCLCCDMPFKYKTGTRPLLCPECDKATDEIANSFKNDF